MKFIAKLERKLGGKNIPNLMIVLIILQIVGYAISIVAPNIMFYLYFLPQYILQGQIWRIFTFLLVPVPFGNVLMAVLMYFIYFSISNSLERIIGRFRLNFFLVVGIILLIISGFIYHMIFGSVASTLMGAGVTTYYLFASLFVLFALMFPDAQFLLMFIIPIKGKWMILITILMYAVDIIQAFQNGMALYGWLIAFEVIASILNIIVFYLAFARGSNISPKQMKRRHEYHQKMTAGTKAFRHKCTVCGRTDITNPDLEFRYCSKCSGNFEYCMEHLYTHIHVIDNQTQD